MSVNNVENITNTSDDFYEAKKTDVSFFDEPKSPQEIINQRYKGLLPTTTDYSLDIDLFLPLDFVKDEVSRAYSDLNLLKSDLESLLSIVYIKSSINQNLEEAHKKLWEEVKKQNGITDNAPNYISLSEYKYAERTLSTSCRRVLDEYHSAVTQASFGYIYDLRRLIGFIQNEAICIRDILLYKFGEDYEDDSQKQTALQFDAWAKMASHFTQRVRQTLTSPPGEIPPSELDKISKKQAVEFQAFFSIRLNVLQEESQNILNLLKRDYVDNCDIFYERYLSQSIQFKKDISSTLELDFLTTSFSKDMPVMSEELNIARNVINSSFGMIMADLVQRNQIISSNVDNLFKLIQSKRRYSNYIYQLSFKGEKKPLIIESPKEDKYSAIFNNTILSYNTESYLISNHSSLDNLHEDHHPQYLLRDGGIITGNIKVESNSTIDGVHLSTHSHNGADGSQRIRSVDVDYSSPRTNQDQKPTKPTAIEVVEYVAEIIDGGVPVIDGIIDIEVDDDMLNDSNEVIIEIIEI